MEFMPKDGSLLVPVELLVNLIAVLKETQEMNKETKEINKTLLIILRKDKANSRLSGNISDLTESSCEAVLEEDSGKKGTLFKKSRTEIYGTNLVSNNKSWKLMKNKDLTKFLSSPDEFVSLCKKFERLNSMR